MPVDGSRVVAAFSDQMNQNKWGECKDLLIARFKTKTRDEWCEIMEGTDICFAPVLSLSEVADHPHNKARSTFIDVDGVLQPAPAPRFSRSTVSPTHGPRLAGEDSRSVLSQCGFDDDRVDQLIAAGVIGAA